MSEQPPYYDDALWEILNRLRESGAKAFEIRNTIQNYQRKRMEREQRDE